jgi:hypothetical protein
MRAELSPALVQIADRRGSPDENHFTPSRVNGLLVSNERRVSGRLRWPWLLYRD